MVLIPMSACVEAAVASGWFQWLSDRFGDLLAGAAFLTYGTWAGLRPDAVLRSVAATRKADLDENNPNAQAFVRFLSVVMIAIGLLLLIATVTPRP